MRRAAQILAFVVTCLLSAPVARADITDDYPHLKKYVYAPPESSFHLGFGVNPVRIMKEKAGISISLFQLHWVTRHLDFEIFNGSYGKTIQADKPTSVINSFTFRTVPKFRITQGLSIGPLAGLEFVNFPQVTARLNRGDFFAPTEPLTSSGWIYGGAISETFPFDKNFTLKLNQVVYKQNYKTDGTSNGWKYYYTDTALNDNQSSMAPGIVYLLEFSLLY